MLVQFSRGQMEQSQRLWRSSHLQRCHSTLWTIHKSKIEKCISKCCHGQICQKGHLTRKLRRDWNLCLLPIRIWRQTICKQCRVLQKKWTLPSLDPLFGNSNRSRSVRVCKGFFVIVYRCHFTIFGVTQKSKIQNWHTTRGVLINTYLFLVLIEII